MNFSSAVLTRSHYQAEVNDEFVDWSVGDMLRDAAYQAPDRLALIVPSMGYATREWTYAQLLGDSERTARALLKRFAPGDRMATWAGGSAEMVILQLGAALAGIVLVTLNPANRAAELEYLLRQGRVRRLMLDRAWRDLDNQAAIERLWAALPDLQVLIYLDQWCKFVAEVSEVALPAVAHAAPAMILFTWGTTGKPKGAVLRHAGIVNNARLAASRIDVPTGSSWLNVLPIFHAGGSVTMLLGCLSNPGTQVLLPDFSAEAMLDALQRYEVRITMAVPTMLVAMMHCERFASTDLSGLEVFATGGTVVAPELVREVKARTSAEVMSLMGQTEAGGVMFLTRRGDDIDRVTHSVGTPLPLLRVHILLADGSVAPISRVGEICVHTPCAMFEYFGMPTKTAETLDAEGWLYTGDLGFMRPDGYVQVTGRLKDMIIRGGENVYPREIEDQLAEHPVIALSAVFGLPDDKWGEQVAAAVIFRAGESATDGTLIEFLQARIARHKVPRFWFFVESLPMNASGKVQKFMLSEQYMAAP